MAIVELDTSSVLGTKQIEKVATCAVLLEEGPLGQENSHNILTVQKAAPL